MRKDNSNALLRGIIDFFIMRLQLLLLYSLILNCQLIVNEQ